MWDLEMFSVQVSIKRAVTRRWRDTGAAGLKRRLRYLNNKPALSARELSEFHALDMALEAIDANPDLRQPTPSNHTTSKEIDPMSTPNPTGEATNLTSSIKFCEASASTARDGVGHVETHSASMASAGVSGEPLRLAASAMELLDQLAATFDELTAELRTHTTVGEAYRTVGEDAGEKQFNQVT